MIKQGQSENYRKIVLLCWGRITPMSIFGFKGLAKKMENFYGMILWVQGSFFDKSSR